MSTRAAKSYDEPGTKQAAESAPATSGGAGLQQDKMAAGEDPALLGGAGLQQEEMAAREDPATLGGAGLQQEEMAASEDPATLGGAGLQQVKKSWTMASAMAEFERELDAICDDRGASSMDDRKVPKLRTVAAATTDYMMTESKVRADASVTAATSTENSDDINEEMSTMAGDVVADSPVGVLQDQWSAVACELLDTSGSDTSRDRDGDTWGGKGLEALEDTCDSHRMERNDKNEEKNAMTGDVAADSSVGVLKGQWPTATCELLGPSGSDTLRDWGGGTRGRNGLKALDDTRSGDGTDEEAEARRKGRLLQLVLRGRDDEDGKDAAAALRAQRMVRLAHQAEANSQRQHHTRCSRRQRLII